MLFLNSSHLANWERLRAPELKFPSGSARDNQWSCLSRGRREGKDGGKGPGAEAHTENPSQFQDAKPQNTAFWAPSDAQNEGELRQEMTSNWQVSGLFDAPTHSPKGRDHFFTPTGGLWVCVCRCSEQQPTHQVSTEPCRVQSQNPIIIKIS